MTDLDRVSKESVIRAALKRLEARDNGVDDYVARNGLDALDAHQKEDAERERRADEFASIIQDKLMAQAAELAELREAVREYLDFERGSVKYVRERRLRQLIGEKP